MAVAAAATSETAWARERPIRLDAEKFIRLPAELALRLLGRAILHAGDGTPLRLGRLEALYDWLAESSSAPSRPSRLRRTLAGALITQSGARLTIERAPPRRARGPLAAAVGWPKNYGLSLGRSPPGT